MRRVPIAARTLPHSACSAVCALIVIALSIATLARANELADDLKARRGRVMERLGPDAMLVLSSAPLQRYSLDVDYEYRQDSNLYYLTGITQDETMLVLMPGNESHREVLFIKDKNPMLEHWRGRSLSRRYRERHGRTLAPTWRARPNLDRPSSGSPPPPP